MESSSSSQSLAIESFSYSWLTSVNSSSTDGPEVPLRPSMDSSYEIMIYKELKMVRSRKSLEEAAQNFNFDVPISRSPEPDHLALADQLFCDGLIKPSSSTCVKKEERTSNSDPSLVPATMSMCCSSKPKDGVIFFPVVRIDLGKWRRLSERVLRKCFGYFRPFCTVGGRGKQKCIKSKRVDDIDRRALEVKSWNCSPLSSPPSTQITLHATNKDWADIERSIDEAVLHCKRSIEKERWREDI